MYNCLYRSFQAFRFSTELITAEAKTEDGKAVLEDPSSVPPFQTFEDGRGSSFLPPLSLQKWAEGKTFLRSRFFS